MPQTESSTPSLPEDRAAILFAQLDVAQAQGEYGWVTEVQCQLKELGWVVTRRRLRLNASPCLGWASPPRGRRTLGFGYFSGVFLDPVLGFSG